MDWSPFYVHLSEGIAIKLSPPGTTYHTIFRMFITSPENLQTNACPKKYVTESSLQNSLIQKQPSVSSLVRKKANWVFVSEVTEIVSAVNSCFTIFRLNE